MLHDVHFQMLMSKDCQLLYIQFDWKLLRHIWCSHHQFQTLFWQIT